MTRIYHDKILGAYAYPECPHAVENTSEYEDPIENCLCNHPKANWRKCISHSYMDDDLRCPLNKQGEREQQP